MRITLSIFLKRLAIYLSEFLPAFCAVARRRLALPRQLHVIRPINCVERQLYGRRPVFDLICGRTRLAFFLVDGLTVNHGLVSVPPPPTPVLTRSCLQLARLTVPSPYSHPQLAATH